jgi:hypothetical protein
MLSQTLETFAIEETECTLLLGLGEAVPAKENSLSLQEPVGTLQEQLARLVGELEARAQARPLCLALAGSPEDEALARVVVSDAPSGRLLVLLPCEHAIERKGSIVLTLAPLSRAAIAELAHRGAGIEPPPEVLEEIVTASAGLAGASALLVRRWIARVREGRTQVGGLAEGDVDMAGLLDASFLSLSKAARACVVAFMLSPENGEAGGANGV